jgi:hypothetical protein
MNEAEKDSLRQSIKEAEEALAKGLFRPEDEYQLRRMIAYYEDKLKKMEVERDENQ